MVEHEPIISKTEQYYGKTNFTRKINGKTHNATLISLKTGFTLITEGKGAMHFRNNDPKNPISLTEFQLEKLKLLSSGESLIEMTTSLSLSYETIKNTFGARIYPALGVKNKTSAVIKGLQMRFIP